MLIICYIAAFKKAGTAVSTPSDLGTKRLVIIPILFWSGWCGLVAGLLEVGTIVLSKQTIDPNHLYGMSRHFVWLIPLQPRPIPGGGVVRWNREFGLAGPRPSVRRACFVRLCCCPWYWSCFPGFTV